MIKRLVEWLFPEMKKGKRIDFRFVNYAEGNVLIEQGWTLAPEEDGNRVFGMVYLELLEKK